MSGRRAAGRGGNQGAAASPDAGRGGQRRLRQRRRRKTLKIVGLAAAAVLVLCAGTGTYFYLQLSGNIHHAALYTGKDQAEAVGVEKPDPLGRTPINLLLIGSDTRDTAADCKIGGACENSGAGANADVEMVVHLSADRSNITVMSIPRDTYANLADCTDPTTKASESGQSRKINSSLQYGPMCTAMTVHKLTGITIDEYAMVDFSGVEQISNALGGVNVCFTHSFYDINSGLKLSQGTHTLKGLSALEFLRTRDSFGDGSDNEGRTTATHIFFTDMINTLKKQGTISNLSDMYSIANAATKALTVSDNIDTIPKLLDLADDLNKVPTNRITFATMQNVLPTDPVLLKDGDVLPGPDAPVLFKAIIDDQSLTAAGGAASKVGKAATAAPSNSGNPGSPSASSTPTPSPSASPSARPSTTPVNTAAALAGTFDQFGNQDKCVQVSTQYTENKLGLPGGSTWNSPGETPEDMYRIYSKLPDSAPLVSP